MEAMACPSVGSSSLMVRVVEQVCGRKSMLWLRVVHFGDSCVTAQLHTAYWPHSLCPTLFVMLCCGVVDSGWAVC
jgi:hypothetical protein